jgi:hypothetical protein
MLNDIQVNKFLIILLFLLGEFQIAPLCIKQIIQENQIFRWIILLLFLIKKVNGFTYFVLVFLLYQILYLVDYSYLHKK